MDKAVVDTTDGASPLWGKDFPVTGENADTEAWPTKSTTAKAVKKETPTIFMVENSGLFKEKGKKIQ